MSFSFSGRSVRLLDPLQKRDLAIRICAELGLPIAIALDIIDAALNNIRAAVERGETVKLTHFGTFQVKTRRARNSKAAPIVAVPIVHFKPSKRLNRRLDKPAPGLASKPPSESPSKTH